MPSPFPGMDPYLEDPHLWPDVHANLIGGVQAALAPRLRPKYVARVQQVTFDVDLNDPANDLYIIPDVRVIERPHEPSYAERIGVGGGGATDRGEGGGVAVMTEPLVVARTKTYAARHRFLEIREVPSRAVVTVIEVLSPANKTRGAAGRRRFERKRDDVTASECNWFEIDLLRAGERSPLPGVPPHDYRVYSDRHTGGTTEDGSGEERPERREVAWPIGLRQRLPVVAVPLRPGEADVPLDLQAVLDACYDRADYAADVDYARPPAAPIDGDDAGWAEGVLREKKLRT